MTIARRNKNERFSIFEFIVIFSGILLSFYVEQSWTVSEGRADRIQNLESLTAEVSEMITYTEGRIYDMKWVSETFKKQYERWDDDDPLVFVSNDNGSSFSDGKDASTEPWSTDSSAFQVEIAGGAADTWGLSWTPSTAAAIQVKFSIPTQNTAIFLDYTQVRITYEEAVATYPTDDDIIFKNGTLVLKSGTLEIK